MEHIILYGSKYGSTRQYAEALSRQTGIPALRYQDAPNLSDKKTIIYLGGWDCPKRSGDSLFGTDSD